MRVLLGEETIQRVFLRKIDFILRQIDLLEADDSKFAEISEGLYGVPAQEDVVRSREILSGVDGEKYVFPEEPVTPPEMSDILKRRIEDAGIDWSVMPSDRIISKISVSGKDRTVYVNRRLNYAVCEVQRLKVHEIEVHVYRGANGDDQPFKIFREGLAGYDETEEGLAVVAEDVSGCFDIDKRQMRLYAGRCLGTYLAIKSSFCDVFNSLREFFPDYLAYRLAERTKRGLADTSRKGAFTKDIHYISGSRKLREHIANGGNLSNLYVGKVGIGDIADVEVLLEEGLLRRPRFLPGFIK